jgi:hypothetical protein
MIKLSAAGGESVGGATIWESNIIAHPLLSGDSYTDYSLNHNKGTSPDSVEMYLRNDDNSAYIVQTDKFDSNGSSHTYFYGINHGQCSDNTLTVSVHRIGYKTTNYIKFKLFWL